MTIEEFIKQFNNLSYNKSIKTDKYILKEFYIKNKKLFKNSDDWNIEKHRKRVIDYILENKNKWKNSKYYINRRTNIKIDNDFLKEDTNIVLRISKFGLDRVMKYFEEPFTLYNRNTYIKSRTNKEYSFDIDILYYDFSNLKLRNYFKFESIMPNELEIKEIIEFISKYGLDFIDYEQDSALNEYNYFSQFVYEWSRFKTFNELVDKYKGDLLYEEILDKVYDLDINVNKFIEGRIFNYLDDKTTPKEKNSKNIYEYYKNPISILYQLVYSKNNRDYIKICELCGVNFISKRKDSKCCCKSHNNIINKRNSRKNK